MHDKREFLLEGIVCVTGSLELLATVSKHTFLNVSGSSNFSELLIC